MSSYNEVFLQAFNLSTELFPVMPENDSDPVQMDVNGTFEGLDYGPIFPATISSSSAGKDDNLTMAWWAQTAWTIVFTLMITVAIGGNCIVMWIVIAHRRMRTVTNYFLVNLSTADLLLSTLNCFFNFIYMLQGHWQFGSWYCTVNNFIANVTVAASVFTLTGISCDRYLAIVHPLQPRMSKASSLITIVFIWIASMVSAFPCLMYSTTITYRYRGTIRIACILVWPDGQPTDSSMDFAYQIVFLILTYLVPMVLMVGCYTAMGKVLWGSRSIGEMTQRQLDSIRSKRKVVRMFISIVLIFGLCWLPYHGYFIYTHYDRQILYTKYVQHVYLGFYWFAMANAMVNPLIYYWMNARFRQYFRTAICGWQRLFKRNFPRNGTETPPIIGRHSHSISKSDLTSDSVTTSGPSSSSERDLGNRTGKQQMTATNTGVDGNTWSGSQTAGPGEPDEYGFMSGATWKPQSERETSNGMEDRCKNPLRQSNHKCEEMHRKNTLISRIPAEQNPHTVIVEDQAGRRKTENGYHPNNATTQL